MGAPQSRRIKTYQGESGFVYQYFYAGYRRQGESLEYVFEGSSDRKTWAAVSVIIPDASVGSWQESQGREVTDQERYAIAKLALFRFFDEQSGLGGSPLRTVVTPELASGIIEQLDL